MRTPPPQRGYSNSLSKVLVIADDLTGALEAGAAFAQCAMSSVVTVRSHAEAEVLVIDTETRHLAPDRAEAMVASLLSGSPTLVYTKTDSTLRGNIGAELRALHNRYGGSLAYVPAYPELGRTVVGGVLHVDGVPVHESSFANDALNPVTDSRVRALVDPACDCVVFDGTTREHVEEAADAILRANFRIVAGPAAIAGALARRLGSPCPIVWPVVRTCLVVNGSRHETSRRQIAAATFDASWRLVEAEQVADAFGTGSFDALLVFGGDTAYGILESLGRPALRPLGEVLPGVPVSRMEGRSEILISKAGGFGSPDLISHLRSILSGS
jgi:uncharacterized protein YgbK (DUF1537 family)